MKLTLCLSAVLLGLGLSARGEGLNQQRVAPDAKWLVQIDCDSLRRTQVGGYILSNVLGPKLEEMGGQLKFNVSNVLQQIHSLTAYGTEFKTGPDATGVLLINCDDETHKALEGVLAAQILANTNGMVKQVERDDAQNLYSIADQVFIAPIKGGPIVVSKSEEQIDATRELLAGKGASVTASQLFQHFPPVSDSFLSVGIVNAADLLNNMPAQAKVLQMADGGRVALGEKDANLFLNLSLRGKSAQVSRQIQQVMEGMVALVSLGQPDNQELMDLAKSIKVASADQVISMSAQYPTSKAITRLEEDLQEKPATEKLAKEKAPKAKVKRKSKQNRPPASEAKVGNEKSAGSPAESKKAEADKAEPPQAEADK